MAPEARSLAERFWSRVEMGLGCWLWTGSKHGFGYGLIAGDRGRRWPTLFAHRVSWELHFGPIHDRLFVLHRCDNPACVNPAHLFLGTQKDNVRDCASKGRISRGTGRHSAKLDEFTVALIRKRRAAGEALNSLAIEFGVGKSAIHAATTGRTWKHVKEA